VLIAACSSQKRAARLLTPDQKLLLEKYEKITQTDIDPKNSIPLYSSIDYYQGTPYRTGGTTRKGMDCSGFTSVVYKEAYNIKLPRTSETQFKASKKVRKRKLKQGNLVFFHIEEGKKVSHVGIYLANGKFAHASTSKGVRIDDLNDAYYKKHFKRGGKIKTAK